jgi:hypothetical protein
MSGAIARAAAPSASGPSSGGAGTQPGSGPVSSPPATPPVDSNLTVSQLAAYLHDAALLTEVPTDLTPPPYNDGTWGTLILHNGCQLSAIKAAKSKPCVYGDTTSHTSVALFGDSHAGTWFPALEQISKQMHWRLLIFTKAGCSPPVVRLYRKCDVWRKNTEAQIAAIHPAIVFVSWARWIEAKAKAEPGVPRGYGSAWQNGVAAIFQFLRQNSGRVIFISDVPTFDFGAADCVASHMTDVQACNNTPRRTAIVLPKVRREEFRLAALTQVDWIDPIPWFCTSTVCPVVVRNFLVYYDSAHMTPAWSRFIAPVLMTKINSILAAPPGTT